MSITEKDDKIKREEMVACADDDRKAHYAQAYSTFNNKVQVDLKRMMQKHKKELDDFCIDHQIPE